METKEQKMSLKDISAALAQVTSQVLQDSQERMKIGIAEEALKHYDKNGQWPKMVVWENKIRDVKFTLDEAKELTDKQKKIAKVAGHPGKIDAADFTALRAGHKIKEEAELSVDEPTEDDSVFDLVDGEAEYELKEGVELQEGKVVHGVHTIYTGAVVKGMPEGNPSHVDAAHLGRTKALGVPTEKGEKYGKTVRVVVKNNETGDTTHHHVYQRDFQDSKRPRISIRDVGAAREKQAEHFKALHDYLSGKKPTTKYSGKISEEIDLDEAVEVQSDHYKSAHGKAPSGEGSWMFTPYKSINFSKHKEGEHYISVHGKYGEAKKKAQAWAKSKGHGIIKVAEEVDLDEAKKPMTQDEKDRVQAGLRAAMKKSYDNEMKGRAALETAKAVAKAMASADKAKKTNEEKDTPGQEHMCAVHVKHSKLGEGRTVTTQHADPDADGNIEWYDVMFEHGIEKQVPTSDLEILFAESHMHGKRKMKEDVDLEYVDEAVTVKKQNYSWGKMVTVHKGADTSYPLHPEHQAAIKRLRPSGEHSKTSFKDETGRMVHATREGDKVHLVSHGANSDKTTVSYKHFDEEVEYVDEGRGRPRKNPDDPKWKKQNQAKPIKTSKHDDENEEDYGPDTGPEPDQNIINQLKRAHDARSMKGHADVKFADNKVHSVPSHVAKAVLDGLDKLKPSDRLNVQQHIHQSHKNLMAVHKVISKA